MSAQRYHLQTDPTGPRTFYDEVSPRFNGKLTWQPTANDILNATVQFDSYNIIGRAGVPAALATDDLTNQEDAPEWLWLTSWRHLFGSRTFSEIKYTGWWGFFDLSPKCRHHSTTMGKRASTRSRRVLRAPSTAGATK